MQGKLITFEGIDGSGKTTQIDMLVKKMNSRKIPFSVVREPGGTELSEKIRDILLDKKNINLAPKAESLLFVAARSQLMFEKVLPELNENKIVICDRFIDSTIAYQGYGRGLDIEYLKKINFFGIFGRMPDLTIMLDISLEQSFMRMKDQTPDRMELNDIQFYTQVQKGYYEIVSNEPERCKLIDGKKSIEEIFNLIWLHIKQEILKETV